MLYNFKQGFAYFVIAFLVGTIFSSSIVLAQSYGTFGGNSASSVRHGPRPSFQTYYGSNADTYWPILGKEEICENRNDLMLQVPLAGCQPPVVRSDLLAEQNVPVFCQINAININPLIDVSQIRNMQFRGEYPPEVAGSGFHPARAALRTHDTLLGSPLMNNIGYVVVVLKRQPVEAELPDFVNVTLTASIDYISGNAYGVGRSEFILEQVSDSDWESEKLKQSFWNGRYYIRLDHVDDNYADVSIYQGDLRVITTRVNRGETSKRIFVPGMYCRAGLQIAFDDFVAAEKKATIEVSSGNDFDVFDVYEGSRFLDDRCVVRRIEIGESGETGKVVGNCRGEEFELVLGSKNLSVSKGDKINVDDKEYKVEDKGGEYRVELNGLDRDDREGIYILEEDNKMIKERDMGLIIAADGTFGESVQERDEEWYNGLYQKLMAFKQKALGKAFEGNITQSDKYFDEAIEAYEDVADDYPHELEGEYGKQALDRAITLARLFGRDQTRIRLIEKYLETYPEGEKVQTYLSSLSRIKEFDTSLAGEAITFDDKDRVLRLISLDEPSKKGRAQLSVENKVMSISKGDTKELKEGSGKRGEIKLDELKINEARLSARCMVNSGNNGSEVLSTTKKRYTLRLDDYRSRGSSNEYARNSDVICGLDVRLDDIDLQEAAKIRIIPSAEGTKTESNLTVAIGIEKRAIELTPNKVRDKIEELNKTIEKWENIVDKLGTVVKGLKGACFATAALLTLKNFITGLSGEALARQKTMRGENGWTARCERMVANGEKGYTSLDHCFYGETDKIDAEVSVTTAALSATNAKIQAIQNRHITDQGTLGLDKAVDTSKVRADIAQEIRDSCQGVGDVAMTSKKWKKQDGSEADSVSIASLVVPNNIENGLITTDALREILLNCELKKQSLTDTHKENVDGQMKSVAERINSQMVVDWESTKAKELEKRGYPPALFASNTDQSTRAAHVVPITTKMREETGLVDGNITHVIIVNANPSLSKEGDKAKKFGGGLYVLGLQGDTQRGIYNVHTAVKQDDITKKYSGEEASSFTNAFGIGSVKAVDRLSYHNEIQKSDRYVRYFEREPYRGMPAIVPFDVREGWYAATKQTLPAFGGIGSFDASGRVVSFELCNVGENGKIEINTGYGDDLCQQMNLNTGQPQNIFSGLSSSKASSLIQRAQRAIEDAARQHGNKYVTIAGERFEVGEPMVGNAGTNCQDFMSPKDCHLMFNVCDPVICPASRCDFGGTYRVADVVQTGIIGSALLCLPNIKEGIVMPVCLTGIHAGIDALVSIMRNYRDCLQENLESGEMVGICDQIYSIYLCEFFWNQVAPFVNVLIPKLIELAYGQGTRGGAEYLSVMSAWQNMENSVNYFTQSYAVNAMTAFQARSVQEVGTQVCKAFISAKAPEVFDSLIEPESPPQFHAWFDQKTFTSATVPATAQYKVFYHIYSGNDQGTHYNVYLKNPPQSSYYSVSATVPVANGFIPSGEYASETKDFTAPEGYKELCVRINNDEECGFGQVSSSFAVNYLRDSWVNDELKNANIQSEKECVSGSHNIGSVLQPNIQAGVEEFASPEIYNRGVVRICATDNPGKGTDPSRFVDMGHCGDPNVRCWLDQRSVENALTKANIGMKNETLSLLEERAREALAGAGAIMDNSTALDRIRELQEAFEDLKTSEQKEGDAFAILTQVDVLFSELFWNHHKARLLLIKGDVNGYMAGYFRIGEDAVKREGRDVDDGTGGGDGGGTGVVLADIFQGNEPYQEGSTWVVELDGDASKWRINGDNGLEYWFDAEDSWIVDPSWEGDVSGAAEWREELKQALVAYKNSRQGSGGDGGEKLADIFQDSVPREEEGWWVINLDNGQWGIGADNVLAYWSDNGWIIDPSWVDDGSGAAEWRKNLRQALIEYKESRPAEGEGGGDAKLYTLVWGGIREKNIEYGGRYIRVYITDVIDYFGTDTIHLDVSLGFDKEVGGINEAGVIWTDSSKTDDPNIRHHLEELNGRNVNDLNEGVKGEDRCEKCGDGFLNECDRAECADLGDCYFVLNSFSSGFWNKCFNCSDVPACLGYPNEGTCEENMCKYKECRWSDEDDFCFNYWVDVIPDGVKPCRDGNTGRIKIDFGGDIGSYGFRNNGLTYWNGDDWAYVKNDASGWNLKSKSEKQWIFQLEEGFRGWVDSPILQDCGEVGDEEEEEEQPLPFNERFEVRPEGMNFIVYSHLKESDEFVQTGLFMRNGLAKMLFASYPPPDSISEAEVMADLNKPFTASQEGVLITEFKPGANGKSFADVPLIEFYKFVNKGDGKFSVDIAEIA